MNLQTALKIYNRKTSSKEELREALAFFLGVEYEKPVKEPNLFEQCQSFWRQKYEERTGVAYYWQGKDAKALQSLLKQLETLDGGTKRLDVLFQQLVFKLPEWYQKNAYNLCTINSKFNDIIRIIRQQPNGKTNISNDYKARILSDLFA